MKLFLLVLYFLLSLLYFPTNRRKSRYYFKFPVDDRVPFIPGFIVPYVFYYVFKYGGLLIMWNSPYALAYYTSMDIAFFSALIFWYVVPNGVKRHRQEGDSLFVRAIHFLYKHDADGNGFPSAHVFAALNTAYFVSLTYSPWATSIWFLAFLICASTVFVKQHYVVDVAGGILWSLGSIILANMLF